MSELVTNAVVQGMTPVRLRLSSDKLRVFVQVWDGSDRLPVLRDAQPEAVGGRGLVLVDVLSGHWGSYPARLRGKVTWAIVAG